jgi:hypothetical protein
LGTSGCEGGALIGGAGPVGVGPHADAAVATASSNQKRVLT